MEYSADDWRRLGRAVHAERLRRGWSDTKEWAARVGRSTRVVLGLERGEPVGRSTLARVENALGWAPGRAWSILAGDGSVTEQNPRPAAETTQAGVGPGDQSPQPYLSRRTGPDLTDVTTDALLEELARRARANNPDAHR